MSSNSLITCSLVIFIGIRCHALDEIGDISSLEERQQYFRNVDTDMSGGIDLEEFLEVIVGGSSFGVLSS